MKLRIMTYNIHSGRDAWGRLDLAAIGEFIRTLNPDILALNEVRMGTSDVNGDEQARTLAAQLGMHWTFAPAIPYRGGQYGIAVLVNGLNQVQFFFGGLAAVQMFVVVQWNQPPYLRQIFPSRTGLFSRRVITSCGVACTMGSGGFVFGSFWLGFIIPDQRPRNKS